jgi:hypothetical protein
MELTDLSWRKKWKICIKTKYFVMVANVVGICTKGCTKQHGQMFIGVEKVHVLLKY